MWENPTLQGELAKLSIAERLRRARRTRRPRR
jgi:hypothetical protein